jgi:hypothetical protein
MALGTSTQGVLMVSKSGIQQVRHWEDFRAWLGSKFFCAEQKLWRLQLAKAVGTECTLVHCSLYTGCIYRGALVAYPA